MNIYTSARCISLYNMCFCKGNFTDSYKKTIGVDFLERHLRWNNCRPLFLFFFHPAIWWRPWTLWQQDLMTIGFKYSISSSCWEIFLALNILVTHAQDLKNWSDLICEKTSTWTIWHVNHVVKYFNPGWQLVLQKYLSEISYKKSLTKIWTENFLQKYVQMMCNILP